MNKKTKTVLIVTSHYPPNIGGVESHLQALVSALGKRDWQVIVSTYQPLAAKKQVPLKQKLSNLLIYRMPWPGFNIVHKLTPYPPLEFIYLFPGLFFITFFTLIRHYKQVDVIHCQGLVPTAVGIFMKFIFRKRLISSIHNLYFFPKTGAYRSCASWIFSRADLVLVPTKVAFTELVLIGVPKNRITYFRYWLDLKHFVPISKEKAKKLLKWQFFSVFFVGRLIETKGVRLLLDVCKNLPENLRLIIVGDGALKSEVEAAQKSYSNLIFLGRIENEKLPLYYSAADLVVFPTLVDEGWGFVAMESISCGTAVLASKKGGLSDVVSPLCGKLIKPTTKEFTKHIKYYLNYPKKLELLAKNSRPYALKNFGENSVEFIISAYNG